MKKIAPDGMVLCDGYFKSSVGGAVYFPSTATEEDMEKWQAMEEGAADALIAENTPEEQEEIEEEATEEDYLEALARLGVS